MEASVAVQVAAGAVEASTPRGKPWRRRSDVWDSGMVKPRVVTNGSDDKQEYKLQVGLFILDFCLPVLYDTI